MESIYNDDRWEAAEGTESNKIYENRCPPHLFPAVMNTVRGLREGWERKFHCENHAERGDRQGQTQISPSVHGSSFRFPHVWGLSTHIQRRGVLPLSVSSTAAKEH